MLRCECGFVFDDNDVDRVAGTNVCPKCGSQVILPLMEDEVIDYEGRADALEDLASEDDEEYNWAKEHGDIDMGELDPGKEEREERSGY